MKISKFLVLYILSRFAPLESTIIDDDVSKIYGGQRVTAVAYPYALAMFFMEEQHFFCGASALNFYYIVSAAHCLVKRTNTTSPWNHFLRHERLMVIGGAPYIREVLNDPRTDDLQENPAIQRRIIHETFIHINYIKRGVYPGISNNDIGVGKLHMPFTHLRYSVRPISVFSHVFWRALHYQYQIYFANRTCYFAGWGSTVLDLKNNRPRSMSSHLNEIPMQVYQTEHCLTIMCQQDYGTRCTHDHLKAFIKKTYNHADQELCAFTLGRRRGGPCAADSGGPLTCSWVQPIKPDDHRGDVVGHASASRVCGTRKGGPTFFTEYIYYFGFFNIFDMKFIGYDYNPWVMEHDSRCIKEWPNMTHCTRRGQTPTSSSSRLKRGGGDVYLLVFSIFRFFVLITAL